MNNINGNLRPIGVVHILSNCRLDEKNPLITGKNDKFVNYHLTMEQNEILPVLDNRVVVFELAQQIVQVSRQISHTKNDKSLNVQLNELMITFNRSVRAPGYVSVTEETTIGGKRRWQKLIVNDLQEGDEPEGEIVFREYTGDAKLWYGNPLWSIKINNTKSIYPIFAPYGKETVLLVKVANSIDWQTYFPGKGWINRKFVWSDIAKEEAAKQPIEKVKREKQKTKIDDQPVINEVPLDFEHAVRLDCGNDDCKGAILVNEANYLNADTVVCPHCGTPNGPLVDDTTLINTQSMVDLIGLTEAQLEKLAAGNVITVHNFVHFGDSELRKLLKLKKIGEANRMIDAVKDFFLQDEDTTIE
jgi:hypothetical protein